MSFFKRLGSIFSKVFGKIPSAALIVNTSVKLIAPLLNTIVTLTAGEQDAKAVTAVINEVQSDLAVIVATIQDSGLTGDNPKNITNLLAGVRANLSDLLAAGHIKNPDTVAKITLSVNLIFGELDAILGVLAAKSAA